MSEAAVDQGEFRAEEKARAVEEQAPGSLVLGADTVVLLAGSILGKPSDAAEAVRMLVALSGRSHEVLTGIALMRAGACISRVATTQVEFARATTEETT